MLQNLPYIIHHLDFLYVPEVTRSVVFANPFSFSRSSIQFPWTMFVSLRRWIVNWRSGGLPFKVQFTFFMALSSNDTDVRRHELMTMVWALTRSVMSSSDKELRICVELSTNWTAPVIVNGKHWSQLNIYLYVVYIRYHMLKPDDPSD